MSGRINLDNISEDFKSYLQGLGLTEEQVNKIIGDKELLNTDDKTNIVNAINENKTSILELQTEVNGQRLRGINIINTIYDKI